MSYVDGFVVPVRVKNLAAYRRLAKKAGKIWKEYGALDYKEWVGDDTRSASSRRSREASSSSAEKP